MHLRKTTISTKSPCFNFRQDGWTREEIRKPEGVENVELRVGDGDEGKGQRNSSPDHWLTVPATTLRTLTQLIKV